MVGQVAERLQNPPSVGDRRPNEVLSTTAYRQVSYVYGYGKNVSKDSILPKITNIAL